MSRLLTYRPEDVSIAWNGINITSGLAPDTYITLDRNEDAFTLTVGADGTGARTQNANKSGTIELTLMQNSPINALLAAQALADENITSADVVSALTISDPSGSLIAGAEDCWIKKIPQQELGKEYGTRTWMFECSRLTIVPGIGAQ